MARTYQSPDSIVASQRIRKGKSTRGTKNYTTVSSGGSKPRVTAVAGTPTLTHPVKVRAARKEAAKVLHSLQRVHAARKSAPSLSGLSTEQKLPARLATRVGRKQGVEPSLLMGLMEVESGFDPTAGSSAGARGLTQFMPGTAGTHGVQFGASKHAQKTQVKGAASYLKELGVDKDRRNALASYNAGPGNPQAAGDYPETVEAAAKKYKPLDRPGVKPKKKDLKTLRKAGVSTKPKKPFKRAVAKGSKAAKIINPKWDPDSDGHGETFLAKGISPVVKKWSRKFGVTVGEAKADSGHVSPGHLQTGTATDVYPSENTEAGWDRLEKGLAVLGKLGFEVGYDGSVPGTQAWSGHGRGNHAHIEWVGQGSSEDAIKKLGSLTDAQIAAMERGASSGGDILSEGTSGGSSASPSPANGSNSKNRKKGLTKKQRLAKVRSGRTDTSATDADLEALEKKYGAVAV